MPQNMEAVKAFNDELSSIYESKPPVSRAKMTMLTKKAIKGIKFYKHIVQSMEKFIQKCRPEYKVPGLYVIDSVVRQSRHQFGQEKDVFMPRLCKNIISTFKHLYKCPTEDRQRIVRVLHLWQKNAVFPPEIVQQLLEMGGATVEPAEEPSSSTTEPTATDATQPDAGALTTMLAQLLTNPNNPQIQQLTGLLSTSQQAQLQSLVSQVKGKTEPEEAKAPPVTTSSVFQPPQTNTLPPFLQSESEAPLTQPSFNPAILDYDYSDDESPKPRQENTQKPGIDLELLAKLPTVDQLKQLSMNARPDPMPQQFTGPHNEPLLSRDADDRHTAQQDTHSRDHKTHEDTSRDDRSRSASRRRSKKRSRSRSRDRYRHRKRSRSRERHRSRRSRSQEHRSSHRQRSKERNERERKGFPPLQEGCISLCSKTIWIGNLASKVSQQEIKAEVEVYGPVESINMIPPRGCAYICMETREDASKAVQRLRYQKIGGKLLKVDWAPSKELKPEYKEYWVKDHGVNYIPIDKIGDTLLSLKSQGYIDLESVPEDKRTQLEETSAVEEDKTASEGNQAPAPVPGPTMMPVMMRPTFPFHGMNIRQFVPQSGFQLPPTMQNPNQQATLNPNQPDQIKTTAADEQLDGAQKAAAVAASIMSSAQRMQQPVMSVAQRFPAVGQMPVEIRMMPGPSAMMPPHRIGMVPIRMGVPMQIRPGFARMPMPQAMMPFQPGMQRLGMLPQGPMPPQMQGAPPPQDEKPRDIPENREGMVKEAMRPEEGLLPPPHGHPPVMDDRHIMRERGPPRDRMEERMHPHPMGGRPRHPMDERPPFGFRRSPPPRFGFERRPPMNGMDGPRFLNRDRLVTRLVQTKLGQLESSRPFQIGSELKDSCVVHSKLDYK